MIIADLVRRTCRSVGIVALAVGASCAAAPMVAATTSSTPPPGVPPAGAAPAPPSGLGSDPALDVLAQACFDAEMAACDELFNTAPFPSAYSEYGATCAGRQSEDSSAYCVDAFPPVVEPLPSGAVPPGILVSGEVVVPPGEPGTVSVVLSGASDDAREVPIIVRNDTNTVVHDIVVNAVARDAAGTEVAIGHAQYFAPQSVPPGGWTMNTVAFGAQLVGTETIEFSVEFAGGTDDLIVNLPVTDATYQPAGQRGPEIGGTVANDAGQAVRSPIVYVACFDGPVLSDVYFGITHVEEIPVGGASGFTAETYRLNGEPLPCSSFAVAASGLAA